MSLTRLVYSCSENQADEKVSLYTTGGAIELGSLIRDLP